MRFDPEKVRVRQVSNDRINYRAGAILPPYQHVKAEIFYMLGILVLLLIIYRFATQIGLLQVIYIIVYRSGRN